MSSRESGWQDEQVTGALSQNELAERSQELEEGAVNFERISDTEVPIEMPADEDYEQQTSTQIKNRIKDYFSGAPETLSLPPAADLANWPAKNFESTFGQLEANYDDLRAVLTELSGTRAIPDFRTLAFMDKESKNRLIDNLSAKIGPESGAIVNQFKLFDAFSWNIDQVFQLKKQAAREIAA
jgi:hypothetical protein